MLSLLSCAWCRDIVGHVDYSVDLRPKTIWGGSTIPGKKMIKVLVPELGAYQRAQELLNLYKALPETVLVGVAQILQFTPERGRAGPAFRDIGRGLDFERVYPTLYGAMLTDIRDFLKLRFRAKGMPEAQVLDKARLSRAVAESDIGYVINYLVGGLDALSRHQTSAEEDFYTLLKGLRDVATEGAKILDPEWRRWAGDGDMWEEAEMAEPPMSQPATEKTWDETSIGTNTTQSGAAYCPGCGRKAEEKAKYCRACGRSLE